MTIDSEKQADRDIAESSAAARRLIPYLETEIAHGTPPDLVALALLGIASDTLAGVFGIQRTADILRTAASTLIEVGEKTPPTVN